MRRSVFCLANDEEHASRIVDDLKTSGFSHQSISVLMPDRRSTREFATEKHTKAPEGATTGVLTGGAIGGVLGWLAGIGSLAIPGLGPFIAAGPIMAALSGSAIGAAAGGLTGALIGLGIPEFEAKRYEEHVKGGKVLVSVHADSIEEADRVRVIFERHHATDISTSDFEGVSHTAGYNATGVSGASGQPGGTGVSGSGLGGSGPVY